MKNTVGIPAYLLIGGMVSLASPTTASANGSGVGLEEIMVTVQRREESLQKTPVSVSAFSSGDIAKNKIQGVQDVVMRVPSFYSDRPAKTQSSLAMRGAGSLEDSPGSDQAVAIFVDDVYIGENSGLLFDFFDIERIEVLRGPQGTLFGRNVVGGAINIVTRDPSLNPDAAMELTYGRFDEVQVRGFASAPLIEDSLSANIAVSLKNSDGYVKNIYSGNSLSQEDTKSIRGKIKYDAGGPFTSVLSVNYMTDDSSGVARKIISNTDIPSVSVDPKKRLSNQNLDGGYDLESWGISLNMRYDLTDMHLTSISAYRENQHQASVDIDGTELSVVQFDNQLNDLNQFSQEFRLGGETDNLSWIVGAYYLNIRSERTEHVFIQGAPGSFFQALTGGAAFPEILGQEIHTKSYAGFGQATYEIASGVRLTAGARYTWEKKSGNAFCILPGVQCNEVYDVAVSENWSAFTPKATIDVDVADDVMAYATISRGFKSGGFPSNLPTAVEVGRSFAPEHATNYEAGIKARWFDNRLQTNVTAFHVKYTDLQVRQFDGPFTVVGNAGKSSVDGIEAEFTARPIPQLDLFFNYAYTDGKYDSLILQGEDHSGNRLILTPKHAFTIGGEYTAEFEDGGELSLRADVLYKARSYLDVSNARNMTAKYPGIFNAAMSYRFPNNNWEIAIYGKNITNKQTIVTAQNASIFFLPLGDIISGGSAIATSYSEPMTWGISLKWMM